MLKSWFISRCKQLYHLNILILGIFLYRLNIFIFLFCLNHYYWLKTQVSFSSNLARIKICWAHLRAKINVTLVGCWPIYTAQIQSLSSCTHTAGRRLPHSLWPAHLDNVLIAATHLAWRKLWSRYIQHSCIFLHCLEPKHAPMMIQPLHCDKCIKIRWRVLVPLYQDAVLGRCPSRSLWYYRGLQKIREVSAPPPLVSVWLNMSKHF